MPAAVLLMISSYAMAEAFPMISDSVRDLASDEPPRTTGLVEIDKAHTMSYQLQRYLVPGGIVVLPESLAPWWTMSGHIRDIPLDFHGMQAAQIGADTGFNKAHDIYNATGRGVVVAVVDTGVDFSNPDMADAVARDAASWPVMLDADGYGIVLTNTTFYADIKNDRIQSSHTPEGYDSRVFVNRTGVYLDTYHEEDGLNIVIYNSFFPREGFLPVFNATVTADYKIGQGADDFIISKSGVYRFGVTYFPVSTGAGVLVAPILVVDSTVPGVYDTIIPDMSSSWRDYTRFSLPEGESPGYDFDFTDETPIVLGSGNEKLVYDSDGDGTSDYSVGMAGARVLDIYGAISGSELADEYVAGSINATLLEPMDPDGAYLGIMTDSGYHGTAVSGVIVSQGEQEYYLYNDTQAYVIPGIAPDAKILPVRSLWYGAVEYSWLWVAGMDNDGDGWTYSGLPRADIITNSWGVGRFPSLDEVPGYDELSILANTLATPGSIHQDYPGTIMIASAGNSGYGYGTIATPGAASLAISVGATTNSGFVNTTSTEGQPRFGVDTTRFGHVVDFSSRGPTMIGDPRPDILATGAYGFAPVSVTRHTIDSESEPYRLFGGTSMAAPFVAGGAALVIEKMQETGSQYDPFLIKNILMSSANDTGNDVLVQGAGRLDAGRAVALAAGSEGFLVYNNDGYLNLRDVTSEAGLNTTAHGLAAISTPGKPHPMTSWFAGHLDPGQKSSTTYTIYNPTDNPISVRVDPVHTVLIQEDSWQGTTVPFQQDTIMNETGVYAPNYIPLSDVRTSETLQGVFSPNPIPQSSMLSLSMNFEFDQFLNGTDDVYGNDIGIASLYIYDWNDKNSDLHISADELAMVTRAGSWGNVQEMRVSHPQDVFEDTPVVGIYPVPLRFSYWSDDRYNATAIDYTLNAIYYDREDWSSLWVNSRVVEVPPHSSAEVRVTLTAPSTSGVQQGFLKFSTAGHTIMAPVSFAVSGTGDSDGIDHGVLYDPWTTRGSSDWSSWYNSGEWNHRYVRMQDVDAGFVEVSWLSNHTSITVFVADPAGNIVASSSEPGVFGHFVGWPSVDWLGGTSFGGGGFFPVTNFDINRTVLQFPVEEPGMYHIMLHTVTFGGESATEEITVLTKPAP